VIWNVHAEVLLAGGYALFLVGVAVVLELVARQSHQRSARFRTAGFVYNPIHDAWECPNGHHLQREKTDLERKVIHYRAPAHKCNACPSKKHCTDSQEGRLLESRPDGWLQSELNRFHRAISLALLLLAFTILISEGFRYPGRADGVAILLLLIPISLLGPRYFFSFLERKAKASSGAKTMPKH
jgi:hypothetical protein